MLLIFLEPRSCPVLDFNKQMSRIIHRIAGNNIDAIEHFSNSYCLNPIRRLGREIKKEFSLLFRMEAFAGEREAVGGWIPFSGRLVANRLRLNRASQF